MSVIVLIGPSGAGKSTVAHILQQAHGFHLQRTVTTRPQRDAYDTDHIFVSEETYQSMLHTKAFFGTLSVFGYEYGLLKFDPSEHTLLLLRAPAIEEFKTRFTDAYIVEIDAPLTVLEERLVARSTFDRIEPEALEKEIEWGRKVADITIDSSQHTPEEIAAMIATKK